MLLGFLSAKAEYKTAFGGREALNSLVCCKMVGLRLEQLWLTLVRSEMHVPNRANIADSRNFEQVTENGNMMMQPMHT
jgi:hypothetical protein